MNDKLKIFALTMNFRIKWIKIKMVDEKKSALVPMRIIRHLGPSRLAIFAVSAKKGTVIGLEILGRCSANQETTCSREK